jgi:hypothetical protein
VVILFFLLVFLFGWYLAGWAIGKLENDLKSGIKLTGTSEVKTINLFNRTIKLMDGTIVYENDILNDKWKRGDKIYYQTTLTGEHLFECKKI